MSSGTSAAPSTPAAAAETPDSSKLEQLQAALLFLREEAELQNAKCSELAASLEEARHQGAELQREKEEAKAENSELLQNYARLQSSVCELQTRVQEQESKAMVKAQHDSEIHALRKALTGEKFSVSSSLLKKMKISCLIKRHELFHSAEVRNGINLNQV